MRHAIDHRKLRRNPSHRKAMLRNLMNSLVRAERIVTTVPRAKELRRLADRLITLGKKDNTHARRTVFSMLCDKGNTEKLFAGLAGRFSGRAGGYTRIVRTGYRAGDGAEMAILEYLPPEEKKAGARKKKKKAPEKGKPGLTKGKPAKVAVEKKEPAARKKKQEESGGPAPTRKATKKTRTESKPGSE